MGFGGQYGYYTDRETGLVLMGHRYYDPGTGRFLTRDPIGYGGGMNLYGFADGNPVNESDPDGFMGKCRIKKELVPDAYGPLMESLADADLTNANVVKILDKSHGGKSASTHNAIAISGGRKYGAAVDLYLSDWRNTNRIKGVIDILGQHGFAAWYRDPKGHDGTPRTWHRHIHAEFAGANLDLSRGGLQVHRQIQDYIHEPYAKNGMGGHARYHFYNFSEDDKSAVSHNYFKHNRMH